MVGCLDTFLATVFWRAGIFHSFREGIDWSEVRPILGMGRENPPPAAANGNGIQTT